MKKEPNILYLIITFLVVMLFVVPMLSVAMATNFPIDHIIHKHAAPVSYAGTEYSYFNPYNFEENGGEAKEIYGELVGKLTEADWESVITPILKTATNPGEAYKVLEETYGKDIATKIMDIQE